MSRLKITFCLNLNEFDLLDELVLNEAKRIIECPALTTLLKKVGSARSMVDNINGDVTIEIVDD